MIEFFTDVVRYPFLRYACATGILASFACGVVGSFVVVRRITYIAGAIAHCILGGMGIARYLQVVYGMSWCHPLLGAVCAALCAAVVIGIVSLNAREREDTVIGALWAVGMAVGILFISKTPGYNQDLMSYLFGNILMVSPRDLLIIAGLDFFILAAVCLFYNQFLAVCFDEEFARLRGVPVQLFYLLLLCITALTVVLLVTVVGIVMVIALLTLPAAIAGQFARTLRKMMVYAVIISALVTTGGLALSYSPDLPSGATIIVLAGAVYILVILGKKIANFAGIQLKGNSESETRNRESAG